MDRKRITLMHGDKCRKADIMISEVMLDLIIMTLRLKKYEKMTKLSSKASCSTLWMFFLRKFNETWYLLKLKSVHSKGKDTFDIQRKKTSNIIDDPFQSKNKCEGIFTYFPKLASLTKERKGFFVTFRNLSSVWFDFLFCNITQKEF